MGPNRQRRRPNVSEQRKNIPSAQKRLQKIPSLVSSAARDLITDVLHHAATGGSVPVPEKHFDSTLGTKITLQRNAPLSTVEILGRVYEGLGFPRDLVAQYLSDLTQVGELPSFDSVEELLSEEGPFQPFLVQSCFELFNYITLFRMDDAENNFDDDTVDHNVLNEELESVSLMFESQYLASKDFGSVEGAEYREAYFLMLTEDEQKIIIAIRFPSSYPQEPPMVFIQPVLSFVSKGKIPHLSVAPNCTKDLPPSVRRLIIDAAVDVIVSLSSTSNPCGCLVPLLSAINSVIATHSSKKEKVPPPPPTACPSRSELDEKRKVFLSYLRDVSHDQEKKKKDGVAVGSGSLGAEDDDETAKNSRTYAASLTLPERVALKEVKVASVEVEELSCNEVLQRDKRLDESLKRKWEELSRKGSLSGVRRKLPAYEAREGLRKALRNSNVVVIGGETGSGKTTQVPQYLYEFFCESGCGSIANVVCTQPRRLAATSVALRVAEERDDAVGGSVGYSIRMENCISRRTQITYCTTGIILRRLQTDKFLNGVTHVVVDEIHERGVDTDFLLILLRDLLSRRKDLIVVLMSATMDSELFSHYFGGAPVLSIKGRTFPVQVHSLEEVIPLTQYHLEPGSPYEKRDKSSQKDGARRNARKCNFDVLSGDLDAELEELQEQRKVAVQLNASSETIDIISRMNFDVINYELIESIVVHIDQVIRIDGAVLIFMPGIAEIMRTMQQLQSNKHLEHRCIFYNLHSSLGSSDQQGVFARPPRGKRKVIIGTNIMETSITIDDAVYVIDTGKIKENRYNSRKCMSELVTVSTSKANCRQRQGRAGRVREGFCFRLFTSLQYEEMQDHQLCEMHRVSLDSLILQIYSLNLGDEVEYLQKALSPPEEKAIHSSVNILMTLGALTREKRLTSLGQHLANLPLDVRVGKMLIHSALLHCVDPVLTMAACLSVRSPFLGAMELRAEVEEMRRAFTGLQFSDQLSSWFAYSKWITTLHEHGTAAAMKLCSQTYLSPSNLSQIQSTKRQYERYLCEAGFLDGSEQSHSSAHKFLFPPYVSLSNIVYESGGTKFNGNSASSLCILACLVAGLYPNVARIKAPPKKKNVNLVANSSNFRQKPAHRYITFDGADCMIHPSSVAAKGPADGSVFQLVVYVDKIKSSDVFLREVSCVSPLHVILFGGGKLEYLARYKELCVDEVTAFQCEEEEAMLLIHFKDQLHSALTMKINDPSKSWESVSEVVVRAIIKLLNDNSGSGRGLKVIDRRQPRRAVTESLLLGEKEGVNKEVTDANASGIASTDRRHARFCFHCGESDHLFQNCPHKMEEKKGGPSVRCFICGMWHYPLFCSCVKAL